MTIFENPEQFQNGSMSLLIIAQKGEYTLFEREPGFYVIGWLCEYSSKKNVSWAQGKYFQSDLAEALNTLNAM